MVRLLTTFYLDKSAVRQSEYEICLNHNINNYHIDEIILFCEGSICREFNNDKITVVEIQERPTFSLMFNYANKKTRADDLTVIANTDIYFDDSLQLILNCNQEDFWCLTRWDVLCNTNVKFYRTFKSADVWMFRGVCEIQGAEFYLGQLGCDNRLAALALESGYNVKNPSLSIRCYHMHASAVRGILSDTSKRQANSVKGRYVYIIPDNVSSYFKDFKRYGFFEVVNMIFIRRRMVFTALYYRKNGMLADYEVVYRLDERNALDYILYHDRLWNTIEIIVNKAISFFAKK